MSGKGFGRMAVEQIGAWFDAYEGPAQERTFHHCFIEKEDEVVRDIRGFLTTTTDNQ